MINKSKKPLVIITIIILVLAISIKFTLYARETKNNEISNTYYELSKEENLADNNDTTIITTETLEEPVEVEENSKEIIKQVDNTISTVSVSKEKESSTSKPQNNNKPDISSTSKSENNQSKQEIKQEISVSKKDTKIEVNIKEVNVNIENPDEKEDSVKETTSKVNSYVGVPNPKDFYYSYHHGVIEYASLDSCLIDAVRISAKDTVDIINTNCIDVMDENGTLLGEYLYIKCQSGNCNRYKSNK